MLRKASERFGLLRRVVNRGNFSEDDHRSRNTVVNAFEQLLAEGYLEGQVGSGTYVSRVLPEELLSLNAITRSCARTRGKGPGLSARGKVFAAFAPSVPHAPERVRAFQSGVPAKVRRE
ncbi:MAG: hypothetical protein M3444_17395 [Acidobacteriota bacterium]|nr:hypothetical protein [Acidobacteriota bacterium]